MDFDRTVTAPARDLATALANAGRLSVLIRAFGEHLVREWGIDVFDVWWFTQTARHGKSQAWSRAEFRIPEVRGLQGQELVDACTVLETELEDNEHAPPGPVIMGHLINSPLRGTGSSSTVIHHHVAIQANGGRWLVIFMREPVHASKVWKSRWIARQDGDKDSALPDEFASELRAALLEVAVQSFAGHARRQFELEDARTELYRDDLTGLYNSRYLDLALDLEVRRATRFGTKFCVLFVDVDAFKAVNDNHGHLTGSSLLSEMGGVIKDAVREVDIVARYGGDEFVLILLGASVETGQAIAERVRERIAAHKFRTSDGRDVQVTVSIGLAAFPENAKTKEQLLRMADETMYSSKKSGKNQVQVYTVPQSGPGDHHGSEEHREVTF